MQYFVERRQKRGRAERLVQDLVGTQALGHRQYIHGTVAAAAAYGDDFHGRELTTQLTDHLQPVDARHKQIAHDHVGAHAAERLEAFLAVLGLDNRETRTFQHPAQGNPCDRGIVDNQDSHGQLLQWALSLQA